MGLDMRTQDITFISLLAAVLVAGGYILYLLSRAIPLPGGKFVLMAPYLSLIMAIGLKRLKSSWTMALISLVFGGILIVFTPFMGLAILSAGILSHLSSRLLPGTSDSPFKIWFSAAFYPLWGFWLSLIVSNYFTGNLLFRTIGVGLFFAMSTLIYGLALGGAVVGLEISKRVLQGKMAKH
jgi:energy-coupling factor transport system substrate-specific component